MARPGALGGSPPPSGRSRGDAASCTLTCLDGPQVFVSVTKGEGCSLTPARGAEVVTKGSSESSLDSGGSRACGDGHQLFQGTAEPRRRQGQSVRLRLCRASTPPRGIRRSREQTRPRRANLWLCLRSPELKESSGPRLGPAVSASTVSLYTSQPSFSLLSLLFFSFSISIALCLYLYLWQVER